MTMTGSRPIPDLPSSCLRWCRAQPPALLVADEYVEIDLDLWNLRLAERRVDLRLVAGGPDGGRVESGSGYLRRSDLWAAGRRARGSLEESVVALYMCAAWLSGHPLRSGVRRGLPDFRVPERDRSGWRSVSSHGYPLVLHEVANWLDTPGEAMNLLRNDAPHGRAGRGVPDLGFPLASLYLSSLGMAWSQPHIVPVDPAGIGTLVHAGWTEIESIGRMTPRRYQWYLELVSAWAEEAAVDPLVVEMWLVRDWYERRSLVAPTGSSAHNPPGGRLR
ncbi:MULTISPECIES: hypothetical protein [unclassified Dietzia]|uniref:8-oxoguanine DNA glycosylase OGG fold protein n=1 Tax=unclassified Dietzia TaxID=2617939 RepID=UPI000D1FDE37|nr:MULTISPECIES: hypothetical protein [unclassified Dietzia]AVZ39333.1 hypothetical protein CT688_07475 [Dietzia sp. JS16-p6b]